MPWPDASEVTYEQLARALQVIAVEKSEWAGLPIPLPEHKLVLEPRFPYQFQICEINEGEQPSDWECVNSWFSKRLRGNVLVGQCNGRARAFLEPWQATDMIIGTMDASRVWPLEAEIKAMSKLAELIPDHLFRAYIMTGTFIETSKRSGVTYLFRKLRPTVAIKAQSDGTLKLLCALCMHPIGFYTQTWAGAMVPTDDVIAHLLMMRGDEPKFWANANQHSVWKPQAGL